MKNIMKFAAVILLTVLVSAGLSMTAYGTEEGNGASLISGRLNLREGTIADGLSIRGEALTGQQPDAAKEAVYAPIEKLMGSEVHMKSDKNPDHLWGTPIVNLGVKWDKETIENAINASIVPGGRVLDRYKFAADHRAAPQDLDYGIQIDENHIYGFFTEKLAAWNCDPVEATFTARAGTVTEYTQMGASREVIVTPGSNGYSYDFRNCVHEFVELSRILHADADDPTLAVRVVVDQFRLCIECAVDLQHLARNRHIEVTDGLHGFDRTEYLALTYGLALGRHVDEDDLAQLRLRIVRDAYISLIALYANPFMLACIANISRKVHV